MNPGNKITFYYVGGRQVTFSRTGNNLVEVGISDNTLPNSIVRKTLNSGEVSKLIEFLSAPEWAGAQVIKVSTRREDGYVYDDEPIGYMVRIAGSTSNYVDSEEAVWSVERITAYGANVEVIVA